MISGRPKIANVSTNFVERQNLTMRTRMRRFTRLINGFPKKVEEPRARRLAAHMYYKLRAPTRVYRRPRRSPQQSPITSGRAESIVALLD